MHGKTMRLKKCLLLLRRADMVVGVAAQHAVFESVRCVVCVFVTFHHTLLRIFSRPRRCMSAQKVSLAE